MSNVNCSNSATPQKKLPLRLALGVTAGLVLLSTPAWADILITAIARPSIFTSNFEKGEFSKWKKELCCQHSAIIVNSPTRAGKHAVKFTLNKGDPYVASSKRAELRLDSVPANSERWYGFSMFLPSNYKVDPSFDIVTQWHKRPDSDLGESWRSPALSILTQNGALHLHRRWDPNQVTNNNTPGPGAGKETIYLGPYQTGVWTDFVFHIKWSHKSDGLLEVWKNGKLVVTKTGPNTYNDKTGPFLKMGIYKPHWKSKPKRSKTSKRVIYFDEVRVGNANASYKDVMPTPQLLTRMEHW